MLLINAWQTWREPYITGFHATRNIRKTK